MHYCVFQSGLKSFVQDARKRPQTVAICSVSQPNYICQLRQTVHVSVCQWFQPICYSVNICAELRLNVCNTVIVLFCASMQILPDYTVAFLSHQGKRRTIDDLKKKTMAYICVAFLSVEENYGTRVCEAFLSGIIRRWIVSLAAATRRHLDIHTCVF